MIIYIIYSNVYKLILSKRLKSVADLDITISKKLNEFRTLLGPKAISILKNHLCRELLLKYHSSRSVH